MEWLKGKRTAFCRWFIMLGNAAEAALRAGCPPDSAESDGMKMLHSDYCRRLLAQYAQEPPLPMQALVTAGLARLAFGNANDAARLAFSDSLSDDALQKLDLFHVTGIKRDKNGVEIKLADRLAAMEKLRDCANAADHSAAAAALLRAFQGDRDDGEVADADAHDADAECAVLP